MCMFNGRVCLRILSALIATTIWAQSPQSAIDKLITGERLIRENCGECIGRDVGSFDRGITLVEEALREGVQQKKRALLLLVDAYSERSFSSDRKRNDSSDVWRKRLMDTFEELVRDDPRNVDLLMRYGAVMEASDRSKALRIYSRVRKLQPGNAEAAFRIALLHVGAGETKTGVDEFLLALKLEPLDANMVLQYHRKMDLNLEATGNSQYLKELSQAVSEALKKRGSPRQ